MSQITFFIDQLPLNTPVRDSIYLASSSNKWRADHPNYRFQKNADGNFDIRCPVSDADIRIKGVDGGSDVQAVLFDMSDAGTAVFNHNVRLAVDDSFLSVGASDDFIMFHYIQGYFMSYLLTSFQV